LERPVSEVTLSGARRTSYSTQKIQYFRGFSQRHVLGKVPNVYAKQGSEHWFSRGVAELTQLWRRQKAEGQTRLAPDLPFLVKIGWLKEMWRLNRPFWPAKSPPSAPRDRRRDSPESERAGRSARHFRLRAGCGAPLPAPHRLHRDWGTKFRFSNQSF